jgi:fumarylacetoacetate (FAA) hydrolase
MERCRAARRAPLPPNHGSDPAVLQSGSDRFLGPEEAIVLADESWGLDFEATLAAVVDDVSQGVDPAAAREHIRLLVLTNDLTLRHLLTKEFAKGVGFFQAKPARPFAPIAVSPGALGGAWRDGLLHARVDCHLNGERIGSLRSGDDAHFDFGQVIAHAARTRALSAGTIVGTGTISNRDAARGFGCLAERRALELQQGRPPLPFLAPGDTVRIEAFDDAGRSIFGAMANPVLPTTAGAAT